MSSLFCKIRSGLRRARTGSGSEYLWNSVSLICEDFQDRPVAVWLQFKNATCYGYISSPYGFNLSAIPKSKNCKIIACNQGPVTHKQLPIQLLPVLASKYQIKKVKLQP